MEKTISVTISGETYTVSRKQVLNSIKRVQPAKVSKYFVEIGPRRFPPKQLIGTALGIPPIAFTTQYAYSILQRLGFKVQMEP